MNWILIVGIMLVIAGIVFIPLSMKMVKTLKDLNELCISDEEAKSIEQNVYELCDNYKKAMEEKLKAPRPV